MDPLSTKTTQSQQLIITNFNIINCRWEHKLYKQTTSSTEDRGGSSRDLFLYFIWLVEEDDARSLHHPQAEI